MSLITLEYPTKNAAHNQNASEGEKWHMREKTDFQEVAIYLTN